MFAEFYSEDIRNDYLALNKFHSKKFLRNCLVLAVLFLLVGVLMTLLREKWLVGIGVFLIALGLLYYPLILLLNRSAVNRQLRSNSLYGAPQPSRTVFDDNGVTQEQGAGSDRSVVSISYGQMYKAFETAGYFFCYNSNVSAVVVPKAGLRQGDAAEVRAKLAGALGKKFKVK